MFPAPFTLIRVSSIKEASDALEHHGDEAKLLAGGHSLIPLMKLRLATPTVLVDIMRITQLQGIKQESGNIIIGALTRHVDIERPPIVRQHHPLISAAASLVGDPSVPYGVTILRPFSHRHSASAFD